MKRLVIFDWDGTVFDSTDKIVAAMQAAAKKLGVEVLSPDAIRQIIGLGLPEAILTLYPYMKASEVEAVRAAYAHYWVDGEKTPSKAFDGMESLLACLQSKGVLLAVATGKSRKGLNRVWGQSGFTQYFDCSRCADETQSKPAPAMVNEILEQLNVPPEGAVVVGDTTFDLDMSNNAHVDAVGVTWGAHSRQQLLDCSPLICVESVAALESFLLGLVSKD